MLTKALYLLLSICLSVVSAESVCVVSTSVDNFIDSLIDDSNSWCSCMTVISTEECICICYHIVGIMYLNITVLQTCVDAVSGYFEHWFRSTRSTRWKNRMWVKIILEHNVTTNHLCLYACVKESGSELFHGWKLLRLCLMHHQPSVPDWAFAKPSLPPWCRLWKGLKIWG